MRMDEALPNHIPSVSVRGRETIRLGIDVAGAESVVGAGQLMRVFRSSLGAHVADPEHALAKRLFVRRKGRLVPTGEALLLHDEVAELVRTLDWPA